MCPGKDYIQFKKMYRQFNKTLQKTEIYYLLYYFTNILLITSSKMLSKNKHKNNLLAQLSDIQCASDVSYKRKLQVKKTLINEDCHQPSKVQCCQPYLPFKTYCFIVFIIVIPVSFARSYLRAFVNSEFICLSKKYLTTSASTGSISFVPLDN